jgi:S1-C subfamily serine protease
MLVTKLKMSAFVLIATLAVVSAGPVVGVSRAADEPKKEQKETPKDEQPQGFLGIEFASEDEGAQPEVSGVREDGPAAKAGLKQGDVILKIGDKEAKDIPTTIKLARALKPGDKVTVKIKRGDKEMDLKVTVGKRPTEEP